MTRHGRPAPQIGVGSPSALRDANRRRVLDVLAREGAASQASLARRTGLSRATIFNIVGGLREAGVVSVTEQVRGGRRVAEVQFSRRAGLVLGIDLDHRHLRVAVADLSHQILAERMSPIEPRRTADETMALAAEWVEAVLEDLDASHGEVLGVGMGLPAPIDPTSGEVGSSAILPGWVGVPAAEAMTYRLGMPVVVDNDANLGALAEITWGGSRGCDHLVYLKLSAGVGAGLVLGGRIYRGAAGTAGEIGHTTVDERGALCRCGNRGCLESFVGSEALLTLLRATQPEAESIDDLVRLAATGDAGSRRLLADAGRYVGMALANLCNLLAPSKVVVGGELAATGDLLLEPMREIVRRHAIPAAANTVEIVTSDLGERSEVLGALALVLRDELALSTVLKAAG
ncbi:MAG TPA: ROK family transcriptional regulator [Mycobacteriales bacterium]|nr:ROK family transcriptional regulator [Mycobacteriales bacterium]